MENTFSGSGQYVYIYIFFPFDFWGSDFILFVCFSCPSLLTFGANVYANEIPDLGNNHNIYRGERMEEAAKKIMKHTDRYSAQQTPMA